MRNWLLLVYKVPSEPSARRVYVWRKLKRLGAILLHDAVWVLPAGDKTREHLQWLAVEIAEMDGEAFIWQAQFTTAGRDVTLVQQFIAQVGAEYKEILDMLAHQNPDLEALSRRYQQIASRDYFHSPLGEQTRQALIAARTQKGENEA
jgi:hypothetical protein